MSNDASYGAERLPARRAHAGGFLRQWRDARDRRRQERMLEGMSDYVLYDIGVTRDGNRIASRRAATLGFE